jgi:hypothetical protein
VARFEFHLLPQATVTEALRDGGEATYRLQVEGNRLVVTEVHVRSPRGITSRELRERQPRAAREAFEAAMREELRANQPEQVTDDDRRRRAEWGAALSADPEAAQRWQERIDRWMQRAEQWAPVHARLRGKALPKDRLRRLAVTAALYVEAIDRGDRAPNETIARRQRRKASLVRDDLKRARDAGLLTGSGGRGIAGGELTLQALQVLEEMQA